jgi:hypothetical protein
LQFTVVIQLEIERREPIDDVTPQVAGNHRRHDEPVINADICGRRFLRFGRLDRLLGDQ